MSKNDINNATAREIAEIIERKLKLIESHTKKKMSDMEFYQLEESFDFIKCCLSALKDDSQSS